MAPVPNNSAHMKGIRILCNPPGLKASRASTRAQFHRDKLQIWFPGQNVDLNLQMTPTTATTACRQFLNLARPLAHEARG